MIENTILCVRWGDKYDQTYVEKLKKQCEDNCSVPFNFYCLTDDPQTEYDLQLPRHWDKYYIPSKNTFWAYRKCYMFNEELFPKMEGFYFLYLDLDVLIHQDLKYFFDLPMDKPYIVRGWWNDIENCRKNYGKIKSTPLNSSVIRWQKKQLKCVYKQIQENPDVIFFSYSTIDNYFNHFWYNVWDEKGSFFGTYPKGDIYSWYKGNTFPNDLDPYKIRPDHKICLFNNSASKIYSDEKMYDIKELDDKW